MTNWNRTQGDVHDVVIAQLGGLDSNGLAAATDVAGHVWQTSSSAPATTLTAVVEDAAASTVRVELDGWLNTLVMTNGAAVWQFEVQVTTGTGKVITWPEGRTATITVYRQGG